MTITSSLPARRAPAAAVAPHDDEDAAIASIGSDDDMVDASLLNVAPHNRVERQLLLGDIVGFTLMSSAALWTAISVVA